MGSVGELASSASAETPGAVAVPAATEAISQFLVRTGYGDLPPKARSQGVRTIVNFMGCVVGGARHPAVEKAVLAMAPFAGRGQAQVLGRPERLDVLNSAMINGIGSHVLDFDDTHLATGVHPGGPVVAAALALGESRGASGQDVLAAVVLGVETACRIGRAVFPEHYLQGWHITGTCGTFGAAAAAGKLLGLDAQQMRHALGLAASQPVGLKIQFGTMAKSFHPGRAAHNGLTAALLAAQGFDAADNALEGKDGWGQTLSTRADWTRLVDGLGARYEAELNSYKPYACGVVLHPAIEAAILVGQDPAFRADKVERIEVAANPSVRVLTGKPAPETGLEAKFSVYHAVAIALLRGAGGEAQFSDQAVRDPAVLDLRRHVTLTDDAALSTIAAVVQVHLRGGKILTRRIEKVVGSVDNPMSDAALDDKARALIMPDLGQEVATKVVALCRSIESLPDIGELARAAAGHG